VATPLLSTSGSYKDTKATRTLAILNCGAELVMSESAVSHRTYAYELPVETYVQV
jgi:hypothetical protein